MNEYKTSRRDFLKAAGIAAIAMGLPATAKKTNPAKPNIIFFIADDMRPEMFNCLGQGKGRNLTPNIDRLVSEGTILTNQHVVSPVCTPSRYNCLTGRYASRATNEEFTSFTRKNDGQTVIQWNAFMTSKDITLAKLLKRNGYATGMVGKNHVVEVKDFYQFPDYDADVKNPAIVNKLKMNSNKIKAAIKQTGFDYAASVYHNNPNFIGLKELAVQNLDWITKGGLDFVDQCKDKPFFLYFATTVPHGPTEDDRSWNADPLITADGYLDRPLDVLPPRASIPKRLKKAGITGGHQKNLLWLDDALGALLNKLEDYGIDDNTVVFFFNDHGQAGKGTVYQGGVFNPSIVWKKGGFKCGPETGALISNVDFAPTILDMAGADYRKVKFDGVSFKDVLDGADDKGRDSLYFELGYARGVRKGDLKYVAVRYPDYTKKFTLEDRQELLDDYNKERIRMSMVVVNEDPSKPFSHLCMIPGGGHAEHESTGKYAGYYDPDQLYDLSRDPGEQNNLAKDPEYKKKLAEMKKELRKYLDDLPGEFRL